MKITAEPRSDQWNAEDFLGGPRTFTVAGVKAGTAEQKYDIELVEGEGRVWRPPLTVLRLLMKAWGDDGTVWVGRRVRLFNDPSITFGRDKVGGIRVSHLSHIDGPVTAMLTETRGKRKSHTVQPLPNEPTDAERIASLRAEWKTADADRKKAIEAEVAELSGQKPPAKQPEQPSDDGFDRTAAHSEAHAEDVDPTLDPEWKGGE